MVAVVDEEGEGTQCLTVSVVVWVVVDHRLLTHGTR